MNVISRQKTKILKGLRLRIRAEVNLLHDLIVRIVQIGR